VLAGFPGAGPEVVERLVQAGLYSPRRIVRGGLAALVAVEGLGEARAATFLGAAETWLAEHPAVTTSPDPEASESEPGEQGDCAGMPAGAPVE
jgi:hypothetical protein